MGRIPGFSNNIFPAASLPYLNLTSTIGLVLFLFLVGLEIDMSTLTKNLRRAGLISLMGMILPFGLGAAVAVPIYHNYVDHELVTFGHFLLFTCVAMSITAFPGELILFRHSLFVGPKFVAPGLDFVCCSFRDWHPSDPIFVSRSHLRSAERLDRGIFISRTCLRRFPVLGFPRPRSAFYHSWDILHSWKGMQLRIG